MKYALLDGELHVKRHEDDTFWPLSLAEAQHVVDVMNAVPPEVATQFVDAALLTSAPLDAKAVRSVIKRAEALLDSDDKPE